MPIPDVNPTNIFILHTEYTIGIFVFLYSNRKSRITIIFWTQFISVLCFMYVYKYIVHVQCTYGMYSLPFRQRSKVKFSQFTCEHLRFWLHLLIFLDDEHREVWNQNKSTSIDSEELDISRTGEMNVHISTKLGFMANYFRNVSSCFWSILGSLHRSTNIVLLILAHVVLWTFGFVEREH